jgi:hypothetical protein
MSEPHTAIPQPMTYTEPSDAVRAGLTVRGRPVSPTQLARWHRTGYLPKPRQVPQGYGRGTVSLYPPGTRTQAERLCAFLSRTRDLEEVGWRLWWDGYPISTEHIRRLLGVQAERWEQFSQALRPPIVADERAEGDAALSEQAWELIEHAQDEDHLPLKPLSRFRRRVGRKDFPTFVLVFLQVLSGQFAGYTDTPQTPPHERQRTILDKASGFHLREMRELSASSQMSQEMEQTYVILSRLLATATPQAALEAATPPQLGRARDLLQALPMRLQRLVDALEPLAQMAGLPMRSLIKDMRHVIHDFDTMRVQDQAGGVLAILLAWGWGKEAVRELLGALPDAWREVVMRALFPVPDVPPSGSGGPKEAAPTLH